MSANVYTKDSLVRVATTFTLSNIATDPTTVTAYYKDPSGSITRLVYGTDAALVKDSTGAYHVDIFANVSGTWRYRFESTGTVVSANEATFEVSYSQIV